MNYIYDIYLNLNEVLFDFFDWNKNDKLSHIKKIPIFKINEDFLKKIIYNWTEVWNSSETLSYCALFTDNNNVIAVEFNNGGISIKKSCLFVDEELEVLEIVDRLNEKDINISIIKKDNVLFKTRAQIKEEKFIRHELDNIEDNKLSYIYFECFGKHEKSKKRILDKLNNISKNSKVYKNLYDILKLTSQAKK